MILFKSVICWRLVEPQWGGAAQMKARSPQGTRDPARRWWIQESLQFGLWWRRFLQTSSTWFQWTGSRCFSDCWVRFCPTPESQSDILLFLKPAPFQNHLHPVSSESLLRTDGCIMSVDLLSCSSPSFLHRGGRYHSSSIDPIPSQFRPNIADMDPMLFDPSTGKIRVSVWA